MRAVGPSLLQRIARSLLRPLSALSDFLGNRFYIGFAVVVVIVAAVAIVGGKTGAMKNKAYDLVMKARVLAPVADPQIVIIDIDEATLAAMAQDYGRWPWPRTVMGELIDGLSSQRPTAIVFDIAFTDPDVFNAEADKYFRDAVKRSANTYFPMIRLVPENDADSSLRVNQLPGVTPLVPNAAPDATIATVLPYFADVLTDSRLGTNNILTDDDGMVRTYPVYADEYGWRVGSLPANVAATLGATLPDVTDALLNWRGKPPSYRHISFYDVYSDLLKKKRTRPANEFTNKIVIIGSTAPGLFDFKPTPLNKTHPGVEILATALDNFKNGDSLRELPPWVYVLITALAVALLATAFVYNVDQRVITLTFTILQTGFLAVSYAFLNFSSWFVDLTAPFAVCLAYFTIARFNGLLLSYRRSGHPLFSSLLDEGNECRVILVECRLHLREANARLRLRGDLKKLAGRTRFGVVTPTILRDVPLLYAFLYDTLVFYWSVPAVREREALDDVLNMFIGMQAVLERAARRGKKRSGPLATVAVHAATLKIDAAGMWRDIGQTTFADLMRAASSAQRKTVELHATPEFERWCRDLGKTVPTLAKERVE